MELQSVRQYLKYYIRLIIELRRIVNEEMQQNLENVLLDITMISFWLGSILVLVTGNKL